MRADALVSPRYLGHGVVPAARRVGRGDRVDEGEEALPLGAIVCGGRGGGEGEEVGEEGEEEGLWGEEDDVLGGGAGEEGLRWGKGGGRVLDAVVRGGDEHFRGQGGGGASEGEEVEVHLRGEAFGDVVGRDPACKGDEVVRVGYSADTLQPRPKRNLTPMNPLPHLIPLLHLDTHQPTPLPLLPRQQDARLLKALPHGPHPVRQPVLMPTGVLDTREGAVVEGVEVPAGEDVGRGEGGGGADAVEEEDLVLGGEEDDGGAGAGFVLLGG